MSSDDSSLIEKLRAQLAASEAEKETLVAQLAEKNRLLSLAPAPVPFSSLASITETGSKEGNNDEEEPTVTQHGMVEFEFGSFSSYNENLKLQKKSKARRKNSVLSSISRGTNATVRSVEEIKIIRNIQRRCAGSEWDNIHYLYIHLSLDANELDNEDEKHHGSTPFYLPPVQMQRWGDDQILPHVNWGDLFFDLFYVGAAFNL